MVPTNFSKNVFAGIVINLNPHGFFNQPLWLTGLRLFLNWLQMIIVVFHAQMPGIHQSP
jgi:hypothetical protein